MLWPNKQLRDPTLLTCIPLRAKSVQILKHVAPKLMTITVLLNVETFESSNLLLCLEDPDRITISVDDDHTAP